MKRYIAILISLVAIATGTKVMAAEIPYAVYTSGDRTLRFYYDDTPGQKEGDRYSMNQDNHIPGWITAGKKFVRVVFTSSFVDYRPKSTFKWFYDQPELTTIENIGYLKTGEVSYMGSMFEGCSGLTNLVLSSWDTSNVTDMSSMFEGCSGLTSLDLSSWDTSKVTYMTSMFEGCSGLTSLNLSSWDTSNVTRMMDMFEGCSGVTSLNLSSWDTSNVTDMSSMFEGCSGLTSLDLSSWNTSNVTYMSFMFSNCISLTFLVLNGWDTSKVESMWCLFYLCEALATIYVGSKWSVGNVTNSDSMFKGCVKLKGGAGTLYNSNHTDGTYAHIDGAPSNPGYLSLEGYDVWVGGKQVNIINKSDVLGDGGSVKYTESIFGKYLTLENANIKNTSEKGQGIYTELPNLNIRVKGNNTIESNGEGIYFTGNLRILSSTDNQDKLNVKGSFGIRPTHNTEEKTLTIAGVDLTAEGTSGAGIGARTAANGYYSCTMKVGSAKTVVKAKGTSVSLGNLKDLVLEDGLQFVQPNGACFDGEDVRDGNDARVVNQWVVIKYNPSIATGLEAIDNGELTMDNSLPLYNLHGQRVSHPVKGQIYIQNGRKVKF